MDETHIIIVELGGVSPADAGRYASELREDLLDISKEIRVELRRNDETAQDFGSTLVLVLGAPAVVVIAKALGDYLRRRRGVRLSFKTAKGQLLAENLTSADATSIIRILNSGEPVNNENRKPPR